MIVPYGLADKANVYQLSPSIQVTRYVEYAPSKIQTNVQENLLILVMHGSKKIVCGDYTTTISQGEFGLFKKGNYIMNQILTQELYESLLIFISDEYMGEIKSLLDTQMIYEKSAPAAPFIHGCIGEHLQLECKQILRLLNEDKGHYEAILNLKIKELILYLLHETSSEQILQFIYDCTTKTDDLCDFMEHNYDKYHDIDSIAHALSMSTSTFKRKFHQVYGCTPGKWMNTKKLEKAASLLHTTDYFITDICFLCGFESISTFNVQFKKKFGMAPGQFIGNQGTAGCT